MKRAPLLILLGIGIVATLPIPATLAGGSFEDLGINVEGTCTFYISGGVPYTDTNPTVSIAPDGTLICVGSDLNTGRSITNSEEVNLAPTCTNLGVDYESWTQIVNPNGMGVLICNNPLG